MRNLQEVLEEALGSNDCETCDRCIRNIKKCDVPGHQGSWTEILCSIAEAGENPELCPVVVGYIQDYEGELKKAKAEIGHYLNPFDEKLGKYLADFLNSTETLPTAAATLRAFLLEFAEQIAEENV